jgi:hypothetical protein
LYKLPNLFLFLLYNISLFFLTMMDECLSLNQSTFKLITRIIATYGSGTWFILRTSKNGFTKTFLNSQLPRVTYRKVLQPFRRIAATPRPMSAHVEMHNSFAIFNFSIQFIKIKLPIISTRQFHLIMWTETAVHFSTMSLLLPVSSFTEMLVFVNT